MKLGNKIRRLRKLKGLTMEELADQSEVTKGFISQLERDKTDPSFSNLKRVIETLGVELTDFFDDLEETDKNLFNKKERTGIEKGRGYQLLSLTPKLRYLEMEPGLLVINPGSAYETSFAEDEGFGFIIRGRLEVSVEGERATMNRGDCFYIFYDNSLKIKNLTEKPAEVLLVTY